MLRVIHSPGQSNPASFPLDPTAEFQAGYIGQLKAIGNSIVMGVSDGTAPFGIIDDVRISAFTKPQIDEIVEIDGGNIVLDENNQRVNSNEVTGHLEFANVNEPTFVSNVDVLLLATNGAIFVPENTPLNADLDDDGVLDGFRIIVSYTYSVANKPGDDSTLGSGRVSIHYQRGTYSTDQFDPLQIYPLNANLYCGLDGKLTTKAPSQMHPSIGIVIGPPSSLSSELEFYWI